MVAEVMKVLQVLPELHGGGVERGTLEIAQFLVAHGHESHVVSAGGRLVHELEAKGSHHHRCEVVAKSPRALIGVFQMRRLMTTLQPDIVHVRSRIPGWVVELAYKTLPKIRRPARISTFHGFHSVNYYSAIMTRGERVIAVSQTVAEHIQQAYGLGQEKIDVIYRGIDPTYFDPTCIGADQRKALRQRWGAHEGQAPVLLLPGRFTRLKGHTVLLEALGLLTDLPWRLVLVGDHGENPSYIQELRDRAGQCGLLQRLHFHGLCDNMPLAYAAADLVLNVSTRPESFGRTAVEAMGMERPVIAAGHGGALETVVEGKTGWCFRPNDVKNLAQVLRNALLHRDDWESIGTQGRYHVTQCFTLERMCAKTLDVYETLSP
nr:glycosyltransferase family 4 protein [uncultured Desulfobulbus sp.]